MNVFVWKSHGDVKVYALNTELREDVLTCLEQEGFEIENENISWGEIQELIYEAQESDSDMFEYGTGIVKLKGEPDGKY